MPAWLRRIVYRIFKPTSLAPEYEVGEALVTVFLKDGDRVAVKLRGCVHRMPGGEPDWVISAQQRYEEWLSDMTERGFITVPLSQDDTSRDVPVEQHLECITVRYVPLKVRPS